LNTDDEGRSIYLYSRNPLLATQCCHIVLHWRYMVLHGVTWRYIIVTLITCMLISTMAATNHTFRTAHGNVTFAVYQGQQCPQEDVGKPGDVLGGGSSVFVKTTEGWKLYLMHSEHSKRIRHLKHPQRVLSLNDGHVFLDDTVHIQG
jgi:hypothetical protein